MKGLTSTDIKAQLKGAIKRNDGKEIDRLMHLLIAESLQKKKQSV